jgi:hypothetical protein
MRPRRIAALLLMITFLAGVGCGSPTAPQPPSGTSEFVIDVAGERFVLRLAHPETIQLAAENLQGRNSRFPLGPLRAGDGGFNQPWSWHLDPEETRFVEVAIEVCDGRPSYVEEHRGDFPTYCPWGARVVSRR